MINIVIFRVQDMQHERQQLHKYVEHSQNPNTVKKVNSVVARLHNWLTEKNVTNRIETMEPSELNAYIGMWIMNLKNERTNDEYEPDTLTSYFRAIDSYIQKKEHGESMLTSQEFSLTRQVLASKRKNLKKKGMWNRNNKSEPLTEEEEKLLWTTGQLGDHGPVALLNTVWFHNTKLLGFRGCDENRKLKWGDIVLKKDENNEEYLEWVAERTTKTRDGTTNHCRSFNPKIFLNKEDSAKCPIR
jgi:hypothetical protein